MVFVVVMSLLSLSAFAGVGDRYCSQISVFSQRCVEQTAADVFYPCTLTDYGEVTCEALSTSDKARFLNSLSTSNRVLAQNTGVPTSFFDGTETFVTQDLDGNNVTSTRPKRFYSNHNSKEVISFSPEKGRVYGVGSALIISR